MNGVMIPSVSAGSSQREASVMCTPHVMVPSGAAPAERTTPTRRGIDRSTPRTHEMERLMGTSQPRGEYTARRLRPPSARAGAVPSALHRPGGETLHHVLLEDEDEQDGGQRAEEPGGGDHRVVDVDLAVHAGDHGR